MKVYHNRCSVVSSTQISLSIQASRIAGENVTLFQPALRIMADPSKTQEVVSGQREAEHVDAADTAKIEAAVDTVHNDEAMKVLASYDGPQDWTEAEEKIVRRKIDKRLLWILCVTYGLQYVALSMHRALH